MLRIPEPALGDRAVEGLFQFRGRFAVLRRHARIAQLLLDVGPEHQRVVHLGVDQAVLEGSPNDVGPVAALLFRVAVGHDLDQPVAVAVAAQHVVEGFLAGRFVPPHPLDVAVEIELLGHVGDETRLRIEHPAPLALVEAAGVVGSRHGVARVVEPTRLDPAVRPDGVIALVIERVGIGPEIVRIVDQQSQLRDPLFLQHGKTAVPAVAAVDVRVDRPQPGDRVADFPHRAAVDAPQRAPVVGLGILWSGERELHRRFARLHRETAPRRPADRGGSDTGRAWATVPDPSRYSCTKSPRADAG